MVETPNYDKVILQQPISQEHARILRKLCELTKVDIRTVYITSIVKCQCKPKTNDFRTCVLENLNHEFDTLNPSTVFVCGSEPSKRYRKFGKREFIELPSMTTLLGNKTGRNRLTRILGVLHES